MSRLTFGADPELFLSRHRSGRPFAVCGHLGGTKEAPRVVGHYGLQEDNVMAEFTLPPQRDMLTMISVARAGVAAVTSEIRRSFESAYALPSCSVVFDSRTLAEAGPQAYRFGCSPDMDAYAQGEPHQMIRPDDLRTPTGAWRFAGGHLHLGYKTAYPDLPEYVVALLCDLTFGVRLVAAGEDQGERRRFYGKAGRYRVTPYGLEYRTPSNQWLFSHDLQMALVDGADVLQTILRQPTMWLERLYNEAPWPDVREAINAQDRRAATNLVRWTIARTQEVA